MKAIIELTRAEEQVMQILWDLERGFVNDLLERFPEPRPAYNTVSTIIRILEKKGVVSHESFGKSHRYYPLIRREDYRKDQFNSLLENYFNNSMKQVVSHFAASRKMDIREADEIIRLMEEVKKNSQNHE
ncbi:MAG: BlaI/MecI/CopY family transcriptional regulator [Bacteroidota bacterium]